VNGTMNPNHDFHGQVALVTGASLGVALPVDGGSTTQ
jgi:hypothetical protein